MIRKWGAAVDATEIVPDAACMIKDAVLRNSNEYVLII